MTNEQTASATSAKVSSWRERSCLLVTPLWSSGLARYHPNWTVILVRFGIGSVLLCVAILIFRAIADSEHPSDSAIKLLGVLLSWPTVALILGLSFGPPVLIGVRDYLAARNVTLSVAKGLVQVSAQSSIPDNSEVSATPPVRLTDSSAPELASPSKEPAASASTVGGGARPEANEVATPPRTPAEAPKNASEFWFFRYLDMFLAARTKIFLNWIASRPLGAPVAEANLWLIALGASADEQATILKVLKTYELITEEIVASGSGPTNCYVLLPVGRDYLAHARENNAMLAAWPSPTPATGMIPATPFVPITTFPTAP